MKHDFRLLIIDPQNDFCDIPAHRDTAGTRPALPVPGADLDMKRLAAMIGAGAPGLAQVAVTLDTHARRDIAHPPFWQDDRGREVAPFTAITASAVRQGRFLPADPADQTQALAYLDELESRGRYTLMVWPVHCEAHTWGHEVHADVQAAVLRWQNVSNRQAWQVSKGTNVWTEHYSAVQAEVPRTDDPSTQVNQALVDWAATAHTLIVAGQAGSHCVRATVEDLADLLPGHAMARLVLLTDCMSPVSGFEAQQDRFLHDMQRRGARLATSGRMLPELWGNA